MIDFYRDKKGDPINVRSLTKKLGAFQVTQGSTSDGKNIYMVFERRHHNGCSRRCVSLPTPFISVKPMNMVYSVGYREKIRKIMMNGNANI